LYKSILLPVDLNHPGSWTKALVVASELATTNDATLYLLTVVPELALPMLSTFLPKDFEADAIKRMAEELSSFANEHVPSGIECLPHVAHGIIRREIVRAADRLNCDLIVMAPHKRELTDFMISPSTGYVVSHSSRSVLVVR